MIVTGKAKPAHATRALRDAGYVVVPPIAQPSRVDLLVAIDDDKAHDRLVDRGWFAHLFSEEEIQDRVAIEGRFVGEFVAACFAGRTNEALAIAPRVFTNHVQLDAVEAALRRARIAA